MPCISLTILEMIAFSAQDYAEHDFAEFPSDSDRAMFADLPEELRSTIQLVPHAQAYFLLHEALRYVHDKSRTHYDIADLVGMIKQFSNDSTNNFDFLVGRQQKNFLKPIPIHFYTDILEMLVNRHKNLK